MLTAAFSDSSTGAALSSVGFASLVVPLAGSVVGAWTSACGVAPSAAGSNTSSFDAGSSGCPAAATPGSGDSFVVPWVGSLATSVAASVGASSVLPAFSVVPGVVSDPGASSEGIVSEGCSLDLASEPSPPSVLEGSWVELLVDSSWGLSSG